MENHRSSLLSWPYYYQGKLMLQSTEDLNQSLLYTTLELETTRLQAQEEIKKRDEQLSHFKELLNKTMKERDEAIDKWQKLLLEKLMLQQQQNQHIQAAPQVHSGVSSIEDDQTPKKPGIDHSNNGFSSSDCEESISIVSSPANDSSSLPENALRLISGKKQLPEKGKLLQAVMNAGPLLQTLLLAGPLPQWRHPPPPLCEIPPVTIPVSISPPEMTVQQDEFLISASNCGAVTRKRGYLEGDCGDHTSPEANKYPRLLLH